MTSEISGLPGRAFEDQPDSASEPVRVTSARLVPGIPDDDYAGVLAAGTVLNDRYEVVELVHAGGMGYVYRARDRAQAEGAGEAFVAIKMSRPAVEGAFDPSAILRHEAAIVQSLDHPNIIRVQGCEEYERRCYLVMEWLDGESVNALLRRTSGRRPAPETVWPLIEGAAAAIGHAHSRDVIHADINPSNLFVTRDGGLKLLDFGVARSLDVPFEGDDASSAWVTQTYASPEILAGLPPAKEDDVFALACVAYRLLSGSHPFGGATSILAKHRGLRVEPVPGLPDAEQDLLLRSLAYTRAGRPASVAGFLPDARPQRAAGERSPAGYWPLAAAVTAVLAVMLAGGWWYSSGRERAVMLAATPAQTPAAVADHQAVDPADQVESEIAERLEAAREAVLDGRLVFPEGDSARDWYRDVLSVDPENAVARRGLREISDDFVRQADTAVRADDPRSAAIALATAAEADPGNPAIDIVRSLLTERGERELAEARAAISAGDISAAGPLIDRAARYPDVPATVLDALRAELASARAERRFAAALAEVDEHISAGRLLAPAGNNASDALAALADRYPADARVAARTVRLGERLLSRAAVAASTDDVAEANRLLDAVASLGVLNGELSAARAALAVRQQEAAREEQAVREQQAAREQPASAEQPAAGEQPQAAPGAAGDGEEPATTAAVEQAVPAAVELAVTAGSGQAAPAVAPAPASPPEPVRLEDLGLERFVPPVYPRSARRRNITGVVDVGFDVNTDGTTGAIEVLSAEPGELFDQSAVDAVRQWQFAPRNDVVRGRVSLRFAVE